MSELPDEMLKVSAGKLFCSACREELGLKCSTVKNHINCKKHINAKEKMRLKSLKEQDIAEALSKHNSDVHLRGDTLPMSQQVYRVKVVTSLLRAGIPLKKVIV